MNEENIQLKNVYYQQNGNLILKNINLNLINGKIVSVIGKNGAGKSTFLKLLLQIIRPSSGEYTLPNYLSSLHIKDNVFGWLPQFLQRPDNITVSEFIQLEKEFKVKNIFYTNKNFSKEQIALINQFDMSNFLSRPITELSGGEWKRLQLLRLWIENKKVIALDEPDSDLDLGQKIKLIEKCKSFCYNENLIFVIASHDLNFIKEVSDRIIVLDDGMLVWDSSVDDFFKLKIYKKVYDISEYKSRKYKF